ncbi:MAG: hypothetical protein QXN55_02210 [Candidatus Nitrosotenuis sp.]
MSTKSGDSFEKRMALILNSAGFSVSDKPISIKSHGVIIGDLDIVAQDPKSGKLIGVSCKEYFSTNPSSENFSHFVEMLEHENIPYGIFASATDISSRVDPRVKDTYYRKGIRIILLKDENILNLEKLIYEKHYSEVEEYFRKNLFLDGSHENTLTDSLGSKNLVYGKTVKCENLLPINFDNKHMPEYIVNGDEFSPHSSTLYLEPYFVLDYGISVEVRHPQTFDVLEKKEEQGTYFIDASKGRILDNDEKIHQHLKKYYTNYVSSESISEYGFTIRKIEKRIDFGEFIKKIRNDIASRNEIRKDYVDLKGLTQTKIVKPKGDQVHILSKHFVYVPIWEVEFKLGDKSYKRKYFAYDGDSIIDDLEKCGLCKNHTRSVCTQCYSTSCENHQRACKECAKILCETCARICIDCAKNSFCVIHTPKTACHVCKKMMCQTCCNIVCKICNLTTCKYHRNGCSNCSSIICIEHQLRKKYTVVTKKFCSNDCLQKYDYEYRSSGLFGKFKKVLGK